MRLSKMGTFCFIFIGFSQLRVKIIESWEPRSSLWESQGRTKQGVANSFWTSSKPYGTTQNRRMNLGMIIESWKDRSSSWEIQGRTKQGRANSIWTSSKPKGTTQTRRMNLGKIMKSWEARSRWGPLKTQKSRLKAHHFLELPKISC